MTMKANIRWLTPAVARTGGGGRRPTRRSATSPAPARLPFVLINMAMTADGKIATTNRTITSFGSRRDQRHLLELRATADAVMCGAATVSSGEIYLGPGPAKYRRQRLRRGLAEYNLRIVVSGNGSLDPDAAIFQKRFSPVLVLTTGRIRKARLARLCRVADEVWVCGAREIDFRAALSELSSARGVRRLLCEGGGELNDALFRAGLVDEVHLTICPLIFGGRLAPTIADGLGAQRLCEAAQFTLKSSRRLGDECFLVFRKRRNARRAKS